MAIKPFHELTLADDFMFGEVMRRPENAKPFLEALLGKKIGSITAIDKQKELTDGAALHGVRLDVCLEDESRTQYDVEAPDEDSSEPYSDSMLQIRLKSMAVWSDCVSARM